MSTSLIRISVVAILCLPASIGCNRANDTEIAKLRAEAEAAKSEAQASKAAFDKEKSRADTAEAELAKLKAEREQPKGEDPDRLAADWALRADAHSVRIMSDGVSTEIPKAGNLPDGPFTVTAINLTGSKKVSDEGTDRLKGLKNLRELNLDSTSISKLDFLDGMTNLEMLNLQNTAVTDDSLKHVKGLKNLKYLQIGMFFGNKQITDATMLVLKDLPHLQTLIAYNCQITDTGLSHLKGHEELRTLHLQQNKFTDAAVESLKSIPNLEYVQITEGQISEAEVSALKDALPKCRFMPVK